MSLKHTLSLSLTPTHSHSLPLTPTHSHSLPLTHSLTRSHAPLRAERRLGEVVRRRFEKVEVFGPQKKVFFIRRMLTAFTLVLPEPSTPNPQPSPLNPKP